jgi:PAP2 superfamily
VKTLLSAFVLAFGLTNGSQVTAQNRPEAAAIEPFQSLARQKSSAAFADLAEAKDPQKSPPPGLRAIGRDVFGDVKHLPATENLYLALAGGALAAAAHPVDQTFNVRLRSHNDAVNTSFAAAKYFGDAPEQVAMSLGTYVYGRVFSRPKVSHLGLDLLRAQIVTELLVQPIKFASGRRRPDGSNAQSFPSGHAAIAFAVATVIEHHVGWPRSLLGYAVAADVAASRLHDNRHYLSDVAFGAAVGTIAGRTVTRHGRDNWTVLPVDVSGGVALLVMRTGS